MNVHVKLHATGEERIIEFYDFEARIAQGAFAPSDLLCDPAITNDEWRRLDDVRLFHRLSPNPYPPSPRLAIIFEKEEQDRKAYEAAEIKWKQIRSEAAAFFKKEETESQKPSRDVHVYLFLRSCDEPPLTAWKSAIRFLYIPTIVDRLLVRVCEQDSGWELVSKLGDGEKLSRALTQAEAQELIGMAQRLDLEQMPVDEDVSFCDGSAWTLELVNQSMHTLRTRSSPLFSTALPELPRRELGTFVEICKYLAKLSGQPINVDEMR